MAGKPERTPWKGGRFLIRDDLGQPNPYTGKKYSARELTEAVAIALQVQRWALASDDAIKKAMRTP